MTIDFTAVPDASNKPRPRSRWVDLEDNTIFAAVNAVGVRAPFDRAAVLQGPALKQPRSNALDGLAHLNLDPRWQRREFAYRRVLE